MFLYKFVAEYFIEIICVISAIENAYNEYNKFTILLLVVYEYCNPYYYNILFIRLIFFRMSTNTKLYIYIDFKLPSVFKTNDLFTYLYRFFSKLCTVVCTENF